MERAESQSPPRMDRRIQIWGMVRAAIVPIASVVVALVIGAVIIALSGANPLVAYSALFEGGLGSGRAFSRTLEKATPLIFGGLAVSLAFKCGLFNIGAQGQLLLGAVFAAFIGFSLQGFRLRCTSRWRCWSAHSWAQCGRRLPVRSKRSPGRMR